MDGSRFDAWTRHRFGLAAGSLAGSLLGLTRLAGNGARAKKKKQRCRAEQDVCKSSGKRRCCKGLLCQGPFLGPGRPRCCRKGLAACQKNNQCCSAECVDGKCACKTNGQECGGNATACCSQNCVQEGDIFVCQPKPV